MLPLHNVSIFVSYRSKRWIRFFKTFYTGTFWRRKKSFDTSLLKASDLSWAPPPLSFFSRKDEKRLFSSTLRRRGNEARCTKREREKKMGLIYSSSSFSFLCPPPSPFFGEGGAPAAISPTKMKFRFPPRNIREGVGGRIIRKEEEVSFLHCHYRVPSLMQREEQFVAGNSPQNFYKTLCLISLFFNWPKRLVFAT